MPRKLRAQVLSDISLEPHTVLKKGEKGTIIHIEEDAEGIYEADVRMDNVHRGLADWNNVAHLVEPELSSLAIKQGGPKINLSLPVILSISILATIGLIEVVQTLEKITSHFFVS